MLASLQLALDQRKADGLLRQRRLLDSPQAEHIIANSKPYLSFCSNDYLGLANHPDLIAAMQKAAGDSGVGSGASGLVTGHHRYHDDLEQQLAAFVKLPAALLFSTGYMANIGVLGALVGRGDAIFADKLNHACLNDGGYYSLAEFNRFTHNDVTALETLLKVSTAKHKLIAVDAVFSMDGDLAPLPEYLALCEKYDAYLYIDDAHGFGVLGEHGEGSLNHFKLKSPRIIMMATLGKAAGVAGAFVAGEKVVIDYLIQTAKSYVYSTPAPPALSATLSASVKLIAQGDELRTHLHGLIAYFKANLHCKKWQLMPSITAVQPLIVGGNVEAVKLSEYLQAGGILVPAIRPPTVPKGTARLRISISAAHSLDDVKALINAIHQAEQVL
ncbi:MAG: 8-amino-7-oxononanoate synthase [Methylotenera sp.]|nr:8-amino-7-oxononanoate synthase [Methylotenera sp.]